MLLGDGTGDSEITIARNYARGAAGRLSMDSLPLTGEYTTYAVRQGTTDVPDYVTDSAASGTGWATGHTTYNNAISVDPVTLQPLPDHPRGGAAGRLQDRQHHHRRADRRHAGPPRLPHQPPGLPGPGRHDPVPGRDEAGGGLGSIAEQTVERDVDVLMGGGKQRFDQTVTGGTYLGQTVVAQAQALGYTVATDQAGLDAAKPATKLLGLFSAGNMDLEWTGPWPSLTPAWR